MSANVSMTVVTVVGRLYPSLAVSALTFMWPVWSMWRYMDSARGPRREASVFREQYLVPSALAAAFAALVMACCWGHEAVVGRSRGDFGFIDVATGLGLASAAAIARWKRYDTHMPNIGRAFPDWGAVQDGEVVVVGSDQKGGVQPVGRIRSRNGPDCVESIAISVTPRHSSARRRIPRARALTLCTVCTTLEP